MFFFQLGMASLLHASTPIAAAKAAKIPSMAAEVCSKKILNSYLWQIISFSFARSLLLPLLLCCRACCPATVIRRWPLCYSSIVVSNPFSGSCIIPRPTKIRGSVAPCCIVAGFVGKNVKAWPGQTPLLTIVTRSDAVRRPPKTWSTLPRSWADAGYGRVHAKAASPSLAGFR